jgi:transcriptional repressor NrdR
MVCIYCGGSTAVINSRLQKQPNQIWRRRKCEECGAVFSTEEAPQLSGSFVLRASDGSLQPFSRDKLYLSIYESCKHRPSATQDATAITTTILGKLTAFSATGEILHKELVDLANAVLANFDSTASSVYKGLHPA